jgi:hypothetical protein
LVKYTSTIPFESALFPGVTGQIRRMSAARRDDLAMWIAEAQSRIHEVLLELEAAEAEADGVAKAIATQKLSDELLRLDRSVRSVHLRWGVKSLEGLEIDGHAADVELLIEAGPEELIFELAAEVRKVLGLSENERKNSPSPITSGAPEDGLTSDSDALLASVTATI